jgi:cation diffusion facilitator family transporter
MPKEHPAMQGIRSSLMGVSVNFVLALAKLSAGFWGHSFALMADGVESLSDVLSGIVVYYGLKISLRPPDKDHPYGHGKAEPIAAVVVGLFLVGAAVGISAESIHEIRTPHPLPAPYTLVILTGVLLLKFFLSKHVARIGESIQSTAVSADAGHHLTDAITSAFAFLGISVALLKRWPAADDWAALCASAVILYNAYRQMRPAVLELADAAPDPTIESKIREIASQIPGVIGLEKCAVRKMGFSYYADLHVVVRGDRSVREGHQIAHTVKNVVRSKLPQVAEVLVHVEPEKELRPS